jgi:hypothetical protein
VCFVIAALCYISDTRILTHSSSWHLGLGMSVTVVQIRHVGVCVLDALVPVWV